MKADRSRDPWADRQYSDMADDLTGLGPKGFERVCQALGMCVLGPGIEIFGDGPDGGREASFRVSAGFPSIHEPWSGYGVMQAKHKARLSGTGADVSWLRTQVRKELIAWADPAGRRATAGKPPDYLIVTTNVPLSGVTHTGGKDRMDALIRQYAPQIGLKDWQVWDEPKITTLLDANPRIRQAFAALITPNEVLARLMAQMDKLGEQPLVSVVLGTAAARPGEPGLEAPFQEAYEAGGGSQVFGAAMGQITPDGPGWVQHFTGGPGQDPAIICALPGKPAAAATRQIWNALETAGAGTAEAGTIGAGLPCPADSASGPASGPHAGAVRLEGGSWGTGWLIPGEHGELRWEPALAFDSNHFQSRDAWSSRDAPMDLRVRVAANIPLAADLRINAQGRTRMLAALGNAEVTRFLAALAARHGIPGAPQWQEMPDPVGRNHSLQAAYVAALAAPASGLAISAHALLTLPYAARNGIQSIVDLRIRFPGKVQDTADDGPPPTEMQLSSDELADFLCHAWHAATMIVPLVATASSASEAPAGPAAVELHINTEHPAHNAAAGAPRPLEEMLDLSAYGRPRSILVSGLSIRVTVPLALTSDRIRKLVGCGLQVMTEDAGFTGTP
jgi:hypothetical protein